MEAEEKEADPCPEGGCSHFGAVEMQAAGRLGAAEKRVPTPEMAAYQTSLDVKYLRDRQSQLVCHSWYKLSHDHFKQLLVVIVGETLYRSTRQGTAWVADWMSKHCKLELVDEKASLNLRVSKFAKHISELRAEHGKVPGT